MKKISKRTASKITAVCKIDRSNISVDENLKLHLKCDKDFMKDMKDMYGLDVHNQKFLRHIFFNTLDGKFSVTVPNKIVKRK